MRDLATGQEKELYRARGIGTLALSPNGRQLAVLDFDATRSVVKVLPASGGEPRELVNFREPEFISSLAGLAWIPNGRQLLFAKGRRAPQQEPPIELLRISVEGGEPQKLGLAMEGLRDLSVHPDGRRIAFAAGQNKAEVWVLENLLPALRAGK